MRLIRIFFSKQDEAAYISHLDLQRVFARALRKSGLPVWYSQGFNPHIYMSFALPLPLGQESVCEAVDCKTESEQDDFSAHIAPLNAALPKGIRAQKIAEPKYKPAEISAAEIRVDYELPLEQIKKILDDYESLPSATVLQKRKKTEENIDLKEQVRLTPPQETGEFTAILPAGSEYNLNPFLFTGFLEQSGNLAPGSARILRTRVLIKNGDEFC